MVGYTDDEIEKPEDLSQKSPQHIQDLIKKRRMETLGLNGNRQKIVPMSYNRLACIVSIEPACHHD